MRQSTAAQRHPDIGYEIADRLCEQDRLEQKDRARAVRYVKGSTHLHPDPAVEELVDAYSRSKSSNASSSAPTTPIKGSDQNEPVTTPPPRATAAAGGAAAVVDSRQRTRGRGADALL